MCGRNGGEGEDLVEAHDNRVEINVPAEYRTSVKQYALIFRVPQLLSGLALFLFLASRAVTYSEVQNSTDQGGGWPSGMLGIDWIVWILFMLDSIAGFTSFGMLFGSCKSRECARPLCGSKESAVAAFSFVAASFVLGNNIAYLAISNSYWRKRILPFIISAAMLFEKLRDVFTISPYFGGLAVQENVGEDGADEGERQDECCLSSPSFLVTSQVFEGVFFSAIIGLLDYASGSGDAVDRAGIDIAATIVSFLMFIFYTLTAAGYLYNYHQKVNADPAVNLVGWSFVLLGALTLSAGSFLASDIEDKGPYPEFAMVLLSACSLISKVRDSFTIDTRFADSIVHKHYNILAGAINHQGNVVVNVPPNCGVM